jgi:hypothetical protein
MKVHQFGFEYVISRFFEYERFATPKQIMKLLYPYFQDIYSEDTFRRKLMKHLKKSYIRHPYLPFYFKNEFEMKIFDLCLRLGHFKYIFEKKHLPCIIDVEQNRTITFEELLLLEFKKEHGL